ncbi:MAG: hypothetical protein Tsb0016_18210 [Sphingomonadales bacterium]
MALWASAWLLLPASLWLLSAGLAAALFYLAVYDFRHQILPDLVTLPLLVCGLAYHGLAATGEWRDAAIGAVAGYAAIWIVNLIYRALRGRDGIGMGDAKLLAAAGAWLGWAALPGVLLLASLSGLAFAGALMLATRRVGGPDWRMPFGPFLALAFWLLWLLRHGAGIAAL